MSHPEPAPGGRRPRCMRRTPRLIGLISLLAVTAVACGSARGDGQVMGGHGPSTPVPGQPVPASAVGRLTAIAERAVAVNGGHSVAWASAVVATREKALTSATPGDTIPNDAKTVVYLVTMRGHFIASAASVPPGGHAPTGTYMSIVIDATTFQGLDGGLSSRPPPVAPASLGPVTFLTVR